MNMKLSSRSAKYGNYISEAAAKWYKEELDLEEQDTVRFFVRYGGVGGRIPGFSLGVSVVPPKQIHTSTTVNNLQFYIEEEDAWYFDKHDLVITFDEQLDEPQFTYQ